MLIDESRTPPLLRGRTAKGTRFGAFVEIGVLTEGRRSVRAVIDATSVVIIDNAAEGDAIGFTGELHFFGMGLGGPGPRAGESVADGDILRGLALSDE
jgi:hypothetical protein